MTVDPWIIYRYELPDQGIAELWLPAGSEFLSVGYRANNKLNVWARVPVEFAPDKARRLYIAMTGHEVRGLQLVRLIGRAVTADDAYVVHVFETEDFDFMETPW